MCGLTAMQQAAGRLCGDGGFLEASGGPPSVDVSVVGCYQNILVSGGSSLSAAHQNVGTALSLKAKTE